MNDEGRRHSAPATITTTSHPDRSREVNGRDQLVTVDDFWSIPCYCPDEVADVCRHEGRCQVPRVSLDDIADLSPESDTGRSDEKAAL